MLTDYFRFGRADDVVPRSFPLYSAFQITHNKFYLEIIISLQKTECPLDDNPFPHWRLPYFPVHHHHAFLLADAMEIRKSKPQNSLLQVMIINAPAHTDKFDGEFQDGWVGAISYLFSNHYFEDNTKKHGKMGIHGPLFSSETLRITQDPHESGLSQHISILQEGPGDFTLSLGTGFLLGESLEL